MLDSKNKTNDLVKEIKEKLKEIKKLKRMCHNYNKDIQKYEKIIY